MESQSQGLARKKIRIENRQRHGSRHSGEGGGRHELRVLGVARRSGKEPALLRRHASVPAGRHRCDGLPRCGSSDRAPRAQARALKIRRVASFCRLFRSSDAPFPSAIFRSPHAFFRAPGSCAECGGGSHSSVSYICQACYRRVHRRSATIVLGDTADGRRLSVVVARAPGRACGAAKERRNRADTLQTMNLSEIQKKWLWFGARFAITFVLLTLLLQAVNADSFFSQIRRVGILPFALGAASYLIATALNTFRWHLLLNARQILVPLRQLFAYNFSYTFYTVVLPGGRIAAEAMRIYQIVRDHASPEL